MKIFALLTMIFLFSHQMAAQEQVYIQNFPNPHLSRYMQWGDLYYLNHIQGLDMLMRDLLEQNPDQFRIMESRYRALKKRQRQANWVLGLGGLTGMAFMIKGVIPTREEREFQVFGQTRTEETSRLNVGWIAAGGVLMIGSAIYYGKKQIRQRDILDFTNFFNRNTDGEPIRFSAQPAMGFGNGNTRAGITFNVVF